MINSKKQKLIKEEIKEKTIHQLEEAVDISKKFASKKFDESLDISIILGIDAKKSDQQIRGVTSLPKMPKKNIRIAVFADGDDVEKAKTAGAEIVGGDDLIDKIKKGEMNFDKCHKEQENVKSHHSLGTFKYLTSGIESQQISGHVGTKINENWR